VIRAWTISSALMSCAVVACSDPVASNAALVPTRDTVALFQTDSLQYTLRAIVVSNGDTYQNPVFVFGAYPEQNGQPKFLLTDLDGVYRLIWSHVLKSYQPRLPFGDPFAEEWRVSNRFRLVAEPRRATP
jgi:hypothetical protein